MSDDKMNENSVEAEYRDIASRNAWPIVYQRIGRESQAYPYTMDEAKKPQNKPLNRYRDVNPYDHSRIVLRRCEGDYINANLVKMERAGRKYILTQGPLAFTVSHFWLMVWEQDSRAILMLNKIIEKNEMKCHWYWPYGVGEKHKITLEDVGLVIEQISEEDCNYFSMRQFKIFDMESETSREVVQFHYTTWPDFGTPSSPVAFVEFLRRVRSSGALEADVGPPVVHCSAGIGRSGTFCLVDSCLVIIDREGVGSVNIQEILLEMRRDRMGLIQTPDQLKFSYEAIIEGARRLAPGFVESEETLEEELYAAVADDPPPPPPPRGESLARPPARPLPAIPNSSSMFDMQGSLPSESSDEGPPPPPPARVPAPPPAPAPAPSPAPSPAPAEEDETTPIMDSGLVGESLRRRRTRELAARVAAMKRRADSAERWQRIKRSLSRPLAITLTALLAGVLVYAYVKH